MQRYDRLQSRYLTTGDFSALQQMNTDYPIETRTLIEKMLQLGTITDANISNRFLMFYQDSTLQSLIADAEADVCQYGRHQRAAEDVVRPSARLDCLSFSSLYFYAQIGALDQSIVVGEHSVGISLDKYMGPELSALQEILYSPAA